MNICSHKFMTRQINTSLHGLTVFQAKQIIYSLLFKTIISQHSWYLLLPNTHTHKWTAKAAAKKQIWDKINSTQNKWVTSKPVGWTCLSLPSKQCWNLKQMAQVLKQNVQDPQAKAKRCNDLKHTSELKSEMVSFAWLWTAVGCSPRAAPCLP